MGVQKRLRLLAATSSVALLAAACSSNGGDGGAGGPNGDLDLISAGTLTVCSDIPYAPFEFEGDDGEFTGYDIEIVRAIATGLDLDLDVQVAPFNGILGSLDAGECDVVASALIVSDERAEAVDFTESYYTADQSLLVPVADEGLTLADMGGRNIGVQSGTTGEAYAEENSPADATIMALEGEAELFAAIETGEVDAILHDAPVNELVDETNDTLVIAEVLPTGDVYAFAVKQGNAGLLAAINNGLGALQDSGRIDELFAEFFA